MKKLLLSGLVLLSVIAANAQGIWVSQATNFTDVSSGVRNVAAVDSNVVWISSYDGSGGQASRQDYSRTTDGGATWVSGVTGCPTTYDWSMICATDANNAWACYYNAAAGSGGGIWHTSDGGATWAQQGVGTIYNASSFPDVVHFWDNNVGFTMGDPNTTEFEIYTTTDGGATWTVVPGANIPNPLAGEYGIVGHYSVIGDNVWFDTNKGRVYHSVDKGLNWTVAATSITVPANGAIDIAFYSATNGIARLYNNTTGANTLKVTADGGATWTAATATGRLLGSDVKYVPGTASRLVSTGAAQGFTGSSYSDNGGLTWVDIDNATQRTALGIVDSNTMWAGGFTTSPTSDGIFKYSVLPSVACGSAQINPGVGTMTDSLVCFGDLVTYSVSGIVAPTDGATFGFGVLVSTADLMGTNDPLANPSVLGGTGVIVLPANPFVTNLLNDGSIFPAGIYYFTPVVFGNATGTGNITGLTLDPACTTTGVSSMVNMLADGDPLCPSASISEINANALSMKAFLNANGDLDLTINSKLNGQSDIAIYDITGRNVYNSKINVVNGLNRQVINVGDLGAGTYVVKVNSNNAQATTRLIKL